jgi:SnoaL-like protein
MDLDTMRTAIEQRDADTVIAAYADDAVVHIVDRNNPPSRPKKLTGKRAIDEFWRDVSSRDMEHRVEDAVVGPDRVSFNEACEYADGTRVLSANVLGLRDGKIVTHTIVQAWDE